MFMSIFCIFWDVFVHYEQIWAECGLPLVLATESKALDKKLGIGCGHRYGMCSGMHCIDRATQSLAGMHCADRYLWLGNQNVGCNHFDCMRNVET